MTSVLIFLHLTCLKILNASRLSSQALVNGTSPLLFSKQFEMNVRKCNLSLEVLFSLSYLLWNIVIFFFSSSGCISFHWWMDGSTFLCLFFFCLWINWISSLTGWIYVVLYPTTRRCTFLFKVGWCKSRNWVHGHKWENLLFMFEYLNRIRVFFFLQTNSILL